MKPLSLRAGLTAWFVALTLLLLGGFSVTLYLTIGRTLRAALDAQLRARAETLVAICEWDEDVGAVEFELSPELAADFAASRAGRGLEVWAWPARRLVHRSGEPIAPPLPPAAWNTDAWSFADCAGAPDAPPRRLCSLLALVPAVAETEYEPAKPAFEVLVRVTESVAPVKAQLARLAWQILALGGASVVVVLAFGLFLSRRFVRPLQELGRAAGAVRAGGPTRMPRRGISDEVDQLAGILEETFAALGAALGRQARFTADAAHELRNPISVIHNAAQVALRNERSAAEYREFLSDVLATSKRMEDIVEALLLLARMDAGVVRSAFRDVDLVAVARESAATLAGGDGAVRIANGAPALVRGEAGLLRVLMDNLLGNALRYSAGRPVEVVVRKEDGGVALSVRDFGPGVPPHARKLVFERFFRADAGGRGSSGAGLGLAIVAEVARVHSAECELEDAAPGALVTVRFPAGAAPAAE